MATTDDTGVAPVVDPPGMTGAETAGARATAAAEEAVKAAEAVAAEAAARARAAADEAVAAEAAAAAAKTALLAATGTVGTEPTALAPTTNTKALHVKAPEWAGPDGFLQYQEDVQLWNHMTTLADDKKGGAMRLALSGVAKEAARNVSVADLILPDGHKRLLECLRVIFGGSEAQRGQEAYRTLKTLYRGTRTMEEYLAAMGQALVQCRVNGYSMSNKTAAAIFLDQAGLDKHQQATTMSAAGVLSVKGHDSLRSITTALRDLWGGNTDLKPSSDAAMMVVTYGEHQAYVARRTTPTPPRTEVYRAPNKTNQTGCWYCGKSGHIHRDCRKRARDEAAAATRAAPSAASTQATDEEAFVAQETAHLVLIADGKDTTGLMARTGDVILDIGATSTIAGAAWVAEYVCRLSPYMRSLITSVEAAAVFTFGDGQTQRAHERVTLPIRIGSQTCHVATWVVAGNLPMLLSRKSMASLGVILDVAGRSMEVAALSVTVPLSMSGAGHLTFNALETKKKKRTAISATKPSPVLHTEVVAVATANRALAATTVSTEERTTLPQPTKRKETPLPAGGSTDPPQRALRAFTLTASSALVNKDGKVLDQQATKLHTQYGHCSAARLVTLLRQAGTTDKKVFEAVMRAVARCDVCQKTAPRPTRPLVTVPRDLKFNDALSVDLGHVAPTGWFLHAIDIGTRVSKAVALPNKEAPTVARALLSGWIVHHGAPRTLLADPGPEFNSAVWRIMAERHNITPLSTAAQAHWSNGIIERHNQTLKTMVTRMAADHPGASGQELLDLACYAKNSMGQHGGATPYQLMNGTTPRVPTAMTDALPALGDRRVPGDEALHRHLQLLHSARMAHTRAEADASLRRALGRNAANVPVADFSVGDAVYFWTDGVGFGRGGWQGPGHVTDVAAAKDEVRLQYGHQWVNRPTSQVRLVPQPSGPSPGAPSETSPSTSAPTVDDQWPPTRTIAEKHDDGTTTTQVSPSPTTPAAEEPAQDETVSQPTPDDLHERTSDMMAKVRAALDRIEAEPKDKPASPNRNNTVPHTAPAASDRPASVWEGRTRGGTRRVHFASTAPTPTTSAQRSFPALLAFRSKEEQEDYAVRLFGMRCSQINKDSHSHREGRLQQAEDAMTAIFTGPDTLEAALRRSGVATHQAFITRREMRRRSEIPISEAGAAFEEAIMSELAAWADLAVYTEVPYDGQTVLSTRWVLTLKEPDSPTSPPRRKARLVVRGFEDPDRDNVDSTSPTASRATFRVALSAMATHGFVPRTVDVRTAFLQGMPLDRPHAVFVQPPPHAKVPAGIVWQLRKCAYGLTDAPRRWYESVLKLMTVLGLVRSTLDHGLFTRHKDGQLLLVVAVHVDDFLFGGTAQAVQDFEAAVRKAFATGPTKSGSFNFTGVRVKTDLDEDTGRIAIRADQEPYVDSIDTIDIRPERKTEPGARLEPEELTLYRRATGALLWATGQTMPYLSCAATTLARRFGHAVVRDLTVANRVVRAAKAARPIPLLFMPMRGQQRLRLFVDASSVKAGVPTAHTGFAIFATSGTVAAGPMPPDAPMTLLLYTSHRQRRVTHSSFAAEVYALLEGVRAALELAAIHAHIHEGDEYRLAPIDAYTDNLSLYNTLDADGVVQPKEVGAAVQELREFYHGGSIASITWLRAHGQLADALTKAGRDTPLQRTLQTGRFGVRLSDNDYLTKSSTAAQHARTAVGRVYNGQDEPDDGRM